MKHRWVHPSPNNAVCKRCGMTRQFMMEGERGDKRYQYAKDGIETGKSGPCDSGVQDKAHIAYASAKYELGKLDEKARVVNLLRSYAAEFVLGSISRRALATAADCIVSDLDFKTTMFAPRPAPTAKCGAKGATKSPSTTATCRRSIRREQT